MFGAAALTLALADCRSQNAKLEQHADKLRSLRATTASVSEAWVAGDVSSTFARLALEQTFRLLEDERAAIAPTARELADPMAAALARESDDLERQVAALVRDIEARDGTAARKRLADVRTSTRDRR